jgi:uncharacterized protein YceH (UPF0502 family)
MKRKEPPPEDQRHAELMARIEQLSHQVAELNGRLPS